MLVNFVVVLSVLLGCCSLALDIGMMELKRLQLQTAADAAATGAMMEAERGNSDWVSAGQNDSALNGFTNGVNGVTVAMTNPPADGPFATNRAAYRAIVTQPVTALFTGKIINVQAQATALMPPCGYLMATQTIYPTLWLQSAAFQATCPIYVSQSMTVDGFATAGSVAYYVGGTATSSGGGGHFNPTPIYSYPAMSDPLSYVASPPPFSLPCTYTSLSIPATPLTTLNPGTYCGTSSTPGLTITGASVTFNPGLYVITGGLSWNFATVSGTNVTLFMTKGGSSNYGQLLIGNSTVNLSAPTAAYGDGSVTGVLIFGDRNWTGTSNDIQLQSDTLTCDGIIYFINTGIYTYNTNGSPPHYFGLVVDNVHSFLLLKGLHLASNFSQVQGGNPFRPREGLVE